MLFSRQTLALTEKTLKIVIARHLLGTLIRAFIAPVVFIAFLSYAKQLFVPPSQFGVGSPTPLKSLSDALALSAGGRNTVAFVNNGFTGGQIQTVIEGLSKTVTAAGLNADTLVSDDDLLETCASSIRGTSACFAAVSFHSSPTEGSLGLWNYTLRADGALGGTVYVDATNNDAQIYALPLQLAVDRAIASINETTLPVQIDQYPYTSETPQEREDNITRLYMNSLIKILAVAYLVGIIGVCYQLTGEMASERELGMAQLIEAMMPNRLRYLPQAARLLSVHLAFDLIYFPSWIIMGLIVARLNYTYSATGISIGFFIVGGLALSSWSVAFASLFKKAQLSGITVTITSLILGIIIQLTPHVSTGAVYVLSLLFPPINFVMFIIYMAYWQRRSLPADLSETAPGAPWQVPGYVFFIFSILHIFIYPLIGALIERALYGTASKARQLRYSEDGSQETVRVTGLTKLYTPSWWHRSIGSRLSKKPRQTTVHAVDGIELSVRQGEIRVLLGANGSGKTTTLSILAGLDKPTAGTVEMDAAGGIGLCPQKNVLWDELTISEHVSIFNRLKASRKDSKAANLQLIATCGLEEKANARSGTLSGGQKRRCQLAMMLTGDSHLCLLDEVSSGLDPISRRAIWNILLAERSRRSILMTTHFMDEADLLSDNITILSSGKCVAQGSAVALKHELGGGYRVHVYHKDAKPLSPKLEAVPQQQLNDQTVYLLPDSAAATAFITEIEAIGISEFSVNGPTIEDAFLKLASEVREELEPIQQLSSSEEDKGLKLAAGRNLSLVGQTWVLFRKRATILRRNIWPYLAALLIPIIAAGLVTLFLQGFSALTCSPTASVSTSELENLETLLAAAGDVPAGPAGDLPTNLLSAINANLTSALHDVGSVTALEDYIAANYSTAFPGGFFLGDVPTMAWRGNYDLSFAIAVLNLMDVSLLGAPILTNFQAFDIPWAPSSGNSLQFVLYFGLAFGIGPAFFALYVNRERISKVRALHYSNGIRAVSLWSAYTLFDFLIVLLSSTLCIIIFTATSSVFYAPGYLWLVFVLYGLSATLTSYVLSLFTTSQLATFAFAAGGQCAFFLIYFVTYLCLITYIPAASVDRTVEIATYTIGAFFPAANLLRALLLTFNEFSATCRGDRLAPWPGKWSVYGSCIFYLILQSMILLTFLVAWDSGWKPAFLLRTKHRPREVEESEDVDPAVHGETKRVEDSSDSLRVLHANKAFGANVAVQDLSFGVRTAEVFALLGPNGAGKSSAFDLIRGDTRPTGRESDIRIQDTSIIAHRAAARRHLGVCPQFDAIDSMTVTEHLAFYARARGIKDVNSNVEQVIQAVGLTLFKTRMAGKLSGGNKRKLSLGISLIGNPSVVLLDEPSSGMDAASKRVMWRTLKAVSAGRALVLTTHSMEEADALADRAGIMSRRMLALGTTDELRKRHGNAYHVHLVHRDAPHTSVAEMDAIKAFVLRTFPGAVTEDRAFHGQLRFSVPIHQVVMEVEKVDGEKDVVDERPASTGIGALFTQLEAHKGNLGFDSFTVSPATLDEVFLNVVEKHRVVEEGYEREHGKKKVGLWKRMKAQVVKLGI